MGPSSDLEVEERAGDPVLGWIAAMNIRPVKPDDAEAMSRVLEELIAAGKRVSPGDPDYVRRTYIDHPDSIQCVIAEDEAGTLLGFQSLLRASEDNKYGTPPGWGIIGTHIAPAAARRGIGSRLFAASREAARSAGIDKIEAYIGITNVGAQAYYEAMGFRTYRVTDDAICKCFRFH